MVEQKYMQVYNSILDLIQSEELASGMKLPSERELTEKYDVSRDTVRKALGILVNQGYIAKSKGRNAIVSERGSVPFPVSEIASFQEINELQGLEAVTDVITLETVRDEKINQKKFSIPSDEELILVVRVRMIDGERVILDKDYFRKSIVSEIPLKAAQTSIYDYLEGAMGHRISYALKEITVPYASTEDKKLLDMVQYNMIAVVSSYTYLADGTMIQYTESRHRPDRFRFIDMARRQL